MKAPAVLRQSAIARFDSCPRSLKLEMEAPPEHQAGVMAARGTLFHRWCELALKQMKKEGWTSYPVEMGMELLLKVLAQRDVPADEVVHLPMSEIPWLRVLVTRWCEGGAFNAAGIIAIEERLYMPVSVPADDDSTYERTITGKPDVLVADPPSGIICIDWKSGWAPPARLEDENQDGRAADPAQKNEKLSSQGYQQQVVYSALILANYPAIENVTLREMYIMAGEYREATVHRHQLERILDVLGGVIAQIDAAFADGPDSPRWVPQAGPQCGICPNPRRCPIKDWEGIPADEAEAVELAREWIVAAEVRKSRAPLLKGWVDANGAIPVDHGKGRRAVGWAKNKTGDGRSFTLHEPTDAPESPWDKRMEEALRAR